MLVAVVPHSIIVFEETTAYRLRLAVFSLESYFFLKISMIPKIIIASNVSIAMNIEIMLIASIPVK